MRRKLEVPIDMGPLPHIEAYKKDIDRTLIRENLKKTPAERAQALEEMARLYEEGQRNRKAHK